MGLKRVKSKGKQVKPVDEISSDFESDAESTVYTKDTFEEETAHEKRIRLTKKAIEKAKAEISNDDDQHTLSSRLRDEALQTHGKLLLRVSHHVSLTKSTRILKGHKKAVTCVCVTSDSHFAFSGGKDSSIIKWDLKNDTKTVYKGGKRESNYPYHTGPVLSIAVSSDSKYIASAGMDQSIIIWKPDTMEVLMKLKRHRCAVTAVSFRKHSHMLFSADCSGRVCVWNMPLADVLQDQGARTNIEVLGLCGLNSERCISCTGFGGPGICVWKVPEEVCVQYTTKNNHETSVECIYAVNDEVFIGGSATNKLYLWHSSRASPIQTIAVAHPPPKLVQDDDDDGDGTARFHRPIANWVTAVAGLANTDLLATSSSTGYVQLWSFSQDQSQRTQIKIERLQGCSFTVEGFVNSLAFTPDKRHLLIGVGQEHARGRWETRRPVDDVIHMIPLNIPKKCFQRM